MANWEAIFIYWNQEPTDARLQSVADIIQRTKPTVPPMLRYQHDKPWLQLKELPWLDSNSETETPLYAPEISAGLRTEVICLYGQTVVDAYGYWHYCDGVLKRCLIYGFREQGVWDRAIGTADVWEDKILFNMERFADFIEDSPEDEVAKYQEIWRTREIQRGSAYPMMNNFDVKAMGLELKLPGFSKALKISGETWTIERRLHY
jgi:hypothetical protein